MPQAHPQTPQSPSSIPLGAADHSKSATSPRTDSLLTPAHSLNDSMSANVVEQEEVEARVPNKRKRDSSDIGDREQKKVHVEDSTIDIGDLHLDVGPKYLLLQTPHPLQQPDTSADLFALYGLESLAVSVERFKPDGTKSVKMRKTYKNHIKDFGISGNFDSVKRELDSPDSFYSMMMVPDQQWDDQYVRGKEIEKGLDFVLPMMGKAFTMSRGRIPKSKWDSSVLGELAAPSPKPPAIVQNGTRPSVPALNPAVPRNKSELPRPKRSQKKRSYEDASYEGYGEGYVDDEAQETGYSTNDGDDRGMNRKRLKKTGASHFPGAPPPRQNSYGPGMVGA